MKLPRREFLHLAAGAAALPAASRSSSNANVPFWSFDPPSLQRRFPNSLHLLRPIPASSAWQPLISSERPTPPSVTDDGKERRCWIAQHPRHIVDLWTAHARKQFETLTEQTKELTALGQKTAAEWWKNGQLAEVRSDLASGPEHTFVQPASNSSTACFHCMENEVFTSFAITPPPLEACRLVSTCQRSQAGPAIVVW